MTIIIIFAGVKNNFIEPLQKINKSIMVAEA